MKLRFSILKYRDKQIQGRFQTTIFKPEEPVLAVVIEGSIKRGSE